MVTLYLALATREERVWSGAIQRFVSVPPDYFGEIILRVYIAYGRGVVFI